ncbi:MAG TPA: response regulator transcription factor [Chthoniobacterales bacterium]|nr:response regulator transcription factor [Chthoniobacterales bacterium]
MEANRLAEDDATGAHPPVRIVVADDHVFMRELISATLSRQSARYSVLASVGTAAAALAACQEFTPNLLILDVNLPDQNGIEAVPAIKLVSPETHILLCTAFPTEDRIVDALRVGAKGFVEKTNSWDDFLVAVDRVARGDHYFSSKSTGVAPPKAAAALSPSSRISLSSLSPREQEVIRLIARGSTSKEIANKLFISAATVETHRTNLMAKLGVRNVASLVLYAFQNGLVDPTLVAESSL